MSALRANCPSCSASLKVTNIALAGKTVKCPKCKIQFVLPNVKDEAEVPTQVQLPTQPNYTAEQSPWESLEKDTEDAKDANPALQTQLDNTQGADTSTSTKRKLIGAVVGVVLLVVVGIIWFSRSKPEDTGHASPGGSPSGGSRPGDPTFTYDKTKLGYDPKRPDRAISAGEWSRKTAIDAAKQAAKEKNVIEVEGRIVGIAGADRPATPGNPYIPVLFQLDVVDVNGLPFGGDEEGFCVQVVFAEPMDWRPFRPGRIVRIVGRAERFHANHLYVAPAVPLSLSGDGDPSVTPSEAAVRFYKDRDEPRPTRFLVERYYLLTGVVESVPNPKELKTRPADERAQLILKYPNGHVFCFITNEGEFRERPPVPGETVSLICTMTEPKPLLRRLFVRGLYLHK